MYKRFFRNGMLMLMASACFIQHVQAAQCQYTVINDWGNGFQAEIKITNNEKSEIKNWAIGWKYTDGTVMANSWNATVSGDNPYTATALNWNANIPVGKSVAFGLTGTNGKAKAAIPTITGDVCTTSNTSSVSSSVSSSSTPSSAISSSAISSSSVISSISSSMASSSSSPSIGNTDTWRLNSEKSRLYFSTTKKINTVENMRFTRLSGAVAANGVATLVIDLKSISSGIEIRNNRMKSALFETTIFGTATVTLPIDSNELTGILVGQSAIMNITAELDLHGVKNDITTSLKVSRLSNSQIMVQNVAPIIVLADDYDLEGGVETLRTLANLTSIGKVVPVNFTLFYNAL